MSRQTSFAGRSRGSASLVVLVISGASAACTGSPSGAPAPSSTGSATAALAAAPRAAATAPASAPPSASASATAASTASASAAPSATPSASASATAPPAAPAGARIYARTRFTWIHTAPGESRTWIGYLSMGGSAPLKGGSIEAARAAPSGGGCDAWYAIEPRGYICAGNAATVDPNDPVVLALQKDGPDLESPWPYQYGEATTFVPRYTKPPPIAEQRSSEESLDKHLERVAAMRDGKLEPAEDDKVLFGVDPKGCGVPFPEVLLDPGPTVRENRARVFPGSTVAWTRTFDGDGGRTFLSTWDHAFVPKDKVRPYPRREFHGVELGDKVQLPIAWFRKKPRPKWRKGPDGALAQTGESWARLAWVGLTGEEAKQDGKRFLATKEDGLWVLADDASVVEKSKEPPFLGPKSGDERRSWLDVSVLGGWLVAYEDTTPVFTTLISPGRGGIPYEGIDPLKTASTPTGTFRVDGKFKTATMVSSTDENLVHSEVQYVQNFHGPHALHGAYWHDVWGEPKSGGCINLSPIDAKHMFEWTDPKVPPGWHGIRSVKDFGPATTVVVHR